MIVIDAPGVGQSREPRDPSRRRALFLDRDGIINLDHGYVHRVEDIDFIDGIFTLGREATARGYLLIVVTNQSGIARGYYSEDDFVRLSNWMVTRMAGEGVPLARIIACPHSPADRCGCRKPEPGLILTSAKDLNLDLSRSVLLGDKATDIEAGVRSGVGTRLLYSPRADAASTDTGPTIALSSLQEVLTFL